MSVPPWMAGRPTTLPMTPADDPCRTAAQPSEIPVLTTLSDAHQVARAAAALVVDALRTGATNIGLATGSSPQGAYAELARLVAAGRLSFGNCDAYLLDEYVGLPHGYPQAYAAVIRRDFVDHVDLGHGRLHGPNGRASDLGSEARCYEQRVVDAQVDVQVLGIGANGHIGFNEPGSPLASTTRVVRLTERTRRDNARFFASPDKVPHLVLTQGLATIMRARQLVLIATGKSKARALADALSGPVSPDCPASVLQGHPDVHVLADPAASALLR